MPAKEEVGLHQGSESGRRKIMPYLLVRHKVEDYVGWKLVFDHDPGATREQWGSKGGRILRNAEDPKELVILLEWDSLENARKFADADELREAMRRESPISRTSTSWKR
jgi:heme-degrading monooxygenase HmoA